MPNGLLELNTYGSIREQLSNLLWRLIAAGVITSELHAKILTDFAEIAAAESGFEDPEMWQGEYLPDDTRLKVWLERRGMPLNIVTAAYTPVQSTWIGQQRAATRFAAERAGKERQQELELRYLEFMSPAARAERKRVAEARTSIPGMPPTAEPYREVGTPREQMAQAEADRLNALAQQWGQIQTVEGAERYRQQLKAEREAGTQRYWGRIWGDFPGAATVTRPFMEAFTGSPNLQRYMRGRIGEFSAQYAQARQDWWRTLHQLETRGFQERPYYSQFPEQRRKLEGQDPLKMALEQYPWESEFLKLPPAQRGFFPSRVAPPAKWY